MLISNSLFHIKNITDNLKVLVSMLDHKNNNWQWNVKQGKVNAMDLLMTSLLNKKVMKKLILF